MTKCRERRTTSERVFRYYKGSVTIGHERRCKILERNGIDQTYCFFPDSGLRCCPIAVDQKKQVQTEKQVLPSIS
jgi:hypothetical protein